MTQEGSEQGMSHEHAFGSGRKDGTVSIDLADLGLGPVERPCILVLDDLGRIERLEVPYPADLGV